MVYSWIQNISVGASIDWDDIEEIRDNLSAADDDSCVGGCTSHYGGYQSDHDSGHFLGHFETHMNPHLSGHLDTHDSGMESTYRVVENESELAAHDTGHLSGHQGTHYFYHNPSNWGTHLYQHDGSMYGIHKDVIEDGDETGNKSGEQSYCGTNDSV